MNIYDWGNFNERKLPEKEYFYSNLNLEIICITGNSL